MDHFEYLLKSDRLNSDQKGEFNAILDKSANQSQLENSANLALQQIRNQAYRSEILQYATIKEVVEVGIAFSGKAVVAAYSI